MKLTFFGGAKTVTGANYLLEAGKTRVMIDCGMFQGPLELVNMNGDDFSYDPSTISHLFITHSHQDHCGRVPKFVAEGFRGQIICTPPTAEMMALALEDAARLQAKEASASGWPAIYTIREAEDAMEYVQGFKYGSEISISPDMSVKILNAGHILGSAMYQFTVTEGKQKKIITFTGDLGNQPSALLPPTDLIDKTDYLVIESAYGDRNHEAGPEKKELLKKVIQDVIWKKGTLLIPSFAIERTQELLYQINNMVEHRQIPPLPIFIDSPLASKMTKIYKKFESYFNPVVKKIINSGDDIFKFRGLTFTDTREASQNIGHIKDPKIIIAGSGMSTGGRILGHEQKYLPFSNNIILFVGYQVHGTLGRQIFEGTPLVTIESKKTRVRASIRGIGGFSAHADQRQLLNIIDRIPTPPKRVFVVQGEQHASFALKDMIESKLQIQATVPKFEETVEL